MFSLTAAVQAPAIGAEVLRATVFVARASCGHWASFRIAADMVGKNEHPRQGTGGSTRGVTRRAGGYPGASPASLLVTGFL